MPPGAKPVPNQAPAAPGRKLKGKELIDAVGDLLNGRSRQDIDGEGEQDERADAGDRDGIGRVGDEGGGHDEGGDEQAGADGGDSGAEGSQDETSIEDVAKALKISASELKNVVVTLPDGERVKLGAMMKGFERVAKFDEERAEFDARVNMVELEQIDAHRRIMAIIDAFPGNAIPPAVLQRVNQQHDESQKREANLLIRARPAWGDPKYVERERTGIVEVARKYGIKPSELGSIVDHRQILLLQDFAHALARIDAAKGAARRVEVVGDKALRPEAERIAQGGRSVSGAGITKKSQLARRVADLIAKG